MMYILKPLTQAQAEEIAYKWHYDGDYSFYDMEADQEDLLEFLDPAQRGDSYYAVFDDDQMIGFFSFTQKDDHTIDIGLGMRPENTGEGNGEIFVHAGIEFAKRTYHPPHITLSVATFNKRAIKVYENIGFQKEDTFMQPTNGSNFEFVRMVYDCE
ncbi:GNAT family N-acetyltransferase [Pontibacillus yanchengensis]|uniref:Acetyltransferase n=1 Tax=Pontibacillus yanchengensis Y32 TaxID=1385514 RepID=A0A0A2TCZ7_9BACI|nr:acetyltransferase [Pontibacillus yanchengensis Y32]